MLSRFFYIFFLEPMTQPPSTPETTRTTAVVEGGYHLTSFSLGFGPRLSAGQRVPKGFDQPA